MSIKEAIEFIGGTHCKSRDDDVEFDYKGERFLMCQATTLTYKYVRINNGSCIKGTIADVVLQLPGLLQEAL